MQNVTEVDTHVAQAPPAGRSPAIKLMIELGPLLLALVAYLAGGFYWATGVLMAAMTLALLTERLLYGHMSPMLIGTTLIVLVFGAMTLWFQDPSFIKMKPTIVNLVFAAVLLAGLGLKRSPLKHMLGHALQLTEDGWRLLTWRWAMFFVALAGLNEFVWRHFSDGAWWSFKAAILPITMAFFASQWPFIKRHQIEVTDTTDKAAKP